MFTLPKAKNSVSDIIGASNWNAIKSTIYNSLQIAIGDALNGVESATLVDIDKLTNSVLGIFKGVDPTFSTAIQSSIMGSVQTSLNKNLNDMSKVILADLVKVIGLS
jgi:ethanolamine ammonia-lyase large subunit